MDRSVFKLDQNACDVVDAVRAVLGLQPLYRTIWRKGARPDMAPRQLPHHYTESELGRFAANVLMRGR